MEDGHRAGSMLFNGLATVIMIAGIALSISWKWWAFIPAFIFAFWIYRGNQKSLGHFAAEAVQRNTAKQARLRALGLIWEIEAGKVAPE